MNQHMQLEPIPFIDISAQRRRLGKSIDDAVARVLDHCQFINGPEVTALEKALADCSGAKHVVSCASGTDALLMVLMAKECRPGRCGAVPDLHLLRDRRSRDADRRDAGFRRRRRGDLQHRRQLAQARHRDGARRAG